MAAAAWKARLRQRVESAHGAVSEADAAFTLLNRLIHEPVPPHDASATAASVSAFRARLVQALRQLTDVARHLNRAVVLMCAAELLALLGGNATNPSVPLPSIAHLGPQDSAEKVAMLRIQVGRGPAIEACKGVEWCRGHMAMAIALVDSPLPTSLFLAQREYTFAYGIFTSALQRTETALADLAGARQILGG